MEDTPEVKVEEPIVSQVAFFAAIKEVKKVEKVHIASLGKDVYIRVMNSAERDRFEGDAVELKGDRLMPTHNKVTAKFLALVLSDEEGNRIFADKAITLLAAQNSRVLAEISEHAETLNGMNDGKEEKLAELAKNLFSGQSEDSPSN